MSRLGTICSDMCLTSHQVVIDGKIGVVVQRRSRGQLQWVRAVFLLRNHVVALAQTVSIGSSVLCCQFQRIVARGGVSVAHNLVEKPQGILTLLSLRRCQVCLPLLRYLVEKSGIFNRSGLFAKSRHILRPVINLIILPVTAPEGASGTVVMLSKRSRGGTPPMCSKIRRIPSSRHSWFCEGKACV